MSPDDENVKFLTDILDERITQLLGVIDPLYSALNNKLNAQEELISNLMMGYMEIAAALESIMEELLAPKSDEEKEEFRRQINKRHQDSMHMIQRVTQQLIDSESDDPSKDVLQRIVSSDESTGD